MAIKAYSYAKDGSKALSKNFHVREFQCKDHSDPIFIDDELVTLLIVLVACHLDTVMGSNFIRDAVVIAFIANETLSIIENAGLMGIPIPKALTGAIEILKQKSEQDSKEN